MDKDKIVMTFWGTIIAGAVIVGVVTSLSCHCGEETVLEYCGAVLGRFY